MPILIVRPLCPELAEQARIELNETPKKLEEGIICLKEWIAKQQHLRARTDDQWLAAFLRGCKHSIERAKEKIDMYYTLRSISPEMIALKYWDLRFEELLKSGVAVMLPKRAHSTDPRVLLLRATAYDATKFTPPDFFAFSYVLQLITYMEDDAFIIAGCTIVFDLTGVNMTQFKQITPKYLKQLIVCAQDAAPIRLKSAHFIGMPSYFQAIFNIGKQFLNEKNREKIHLHSEGFEELYQHISKVILPVECGGNGGTVQEITDHWVKKISEHKSFLEEDLHFGTDESKRPGAPRTAQSLLGIDGYFRQLDFD